jgi:hypothetical protein
MSGSTKSRPLFRAVSKFQLHGPNAYRGKARFAEPEPFLLDEIEVAACLVDRSFPDEIEAISGNYILYFQAALFSFLCPMLTPIVFVYNIVSLPLQRYIHLRCMNRKTIINQTDGLGFWIYLLQYMSTLVVIFNCLFVFWFREQFISISAGALDSLRGLFPAYLIKRAKYFKNLSLLSVSTGNTVIGLTEKQMLDFLIVIVVFEHVVFLIRYLMQDIIGDVPGWVIKKQERAKTQFECMMQEKEQIKQEKECARIKAEIEADKSQFAADMKSYKKAYYQISKEIEDERDQVKDLDKKIKQLEGYISLEEGKIARTKTEEDRVFTVEPKLLDFFQDRFDFELSRNQAKQDKMESNLHRQLMHRLFRQTYYYIERQVIQKRLASISTIDKRNLINCIDC